MRVQISGHRVPLPSVQFDRMGALKAPKMWKISCPLLESVSIASLRLRRPIPLGAERFSMGDQILERAPQPIQTPNDERVPCAEMVQGIAEARSLSCTARMILEDAIAPCFPECIALEVEGLVVGRDARVTNQHGRCPKKVRTR